MAGENSGEFILLRDTQNSLFEQVLGIYRGAFPANERHPDSRIAERVSAGFYDLLVGEEKGSVRFFALVHELSQTRFTLLDYFALREDLKSRGLGSQVFKMIQNRVQKKDRHLLMEVEDPDFGEDTATRQRRLQFYLKHGARTLADVPYKIPPFVKGASPTEMRLLVVPGHPADSFSGSETKELVTRLYGDIYLRNSDDPLLASILQDIPQRVILE